MVKLYHLGESTCSQRVRLVLAEKDIEWESVLIHPSDLRSEAYLALNPAGVVPTLEHTGHVLVESRIICEYLDEAFPETPLMPLRPVDRYKVRRWTKSYDDKLHLAVFVLSFICWMRDRYLAMPQETRGLALPGMTDPVKRAISQNLLENGWESHILAITLRLVVGFTDQLELALGESRWLCGDRYTLADIDMFTVVQRLEDLGLGMLLNERAALAGWFDRARSRPSFALSFSAWRDSNVMESNRKRAGEATERFADLLSTF